MDGGTIRDIRTGRAIGRTNSLTDAFAHKVEQMINDEQPFYIVHGRCRSQVVRQLVHDLRSLQVLTVVYDGQFPSDTVWIFEGEPSELGFAV